jgi:hypothetical protein
LVPITQMQNNSHNLEVFMMKEKFQFGSTLEVKQ